MRVKCSRCSRAAVCIDPFHPWETDYTVCEECLKQVEAERMSRVELSGELSICQPQVRAQVVVASSKKKGSWLKMLQGLFKKGG